MIIQTKRRRGKTVEQVLSFFFFLLPELNTSINPAANINAFEHISGLFFCLLITEEYKKQKNALENTTHCCVIFVCLSMKINRIACNAHFFRSFFHCFDLFLFLFFCVSSGLLFRCSAWCFSIFIFYFLG